MRLGHVHVHVKDLAAGVRWFHDVLGAEPAYRDDEMALFAFDGGGVILNEGADDRSIVAFAVSDCDAAFRDAVARGAAALEPPEDKTYGVRAAYVRGPGSLQVEFEQAL